MPYQSSDGSISDYKRPKDIQDSFEQPNDNVSKVQIQAAKTLFDALLNGQFNHIHHSPLLPAKIASNLQQLPFLSSKNAGKKSIIKIDK